MELLELAHLPLSTPAQVAVTSISQIGVRNCLETAGRVKARGELVGQCFVLQKAVGAGRANGLWTSMVARHSGSVIRGRSTGLSIERGPICRHSRPYAAVDRDHFGKRGVNRGHRGTAVDLGGGRGRHDRHAENGGSAR